MNDIRRCYEILGLEPDASNEEIKDAYRTLARTWHPDRFPTDPQLKQRAEEVIKRINGAYQQLKSYQRTGQSGSQTPTSETRIQSNSSRAETHYNQAMERIHTRRYHEAIEEFSKAIRINPNYIEAYEGRGLACSNLGYENRALSDLAKASELKWKQQKQATQPAPVSKPSPWKSISTFTGHSSLVTALVISPDGKSLVSGSRDKSIKVWQLASGTLLHTFKGHLEAIHSVVISPDGKTLVSGSRDKSIKVWGLDTGHLLPTLMGHADSVNCIALSPDGQLLVSCSSDKTIKLWHLGMGQFLRLFKGHANSVSSVAFAPGTPILVSSSLIEIKLWQLPTGKEICTLRGHSTSVSFIALSPDAQMLVSTSSDGTIKLWQLDAGREVSTFKDDIDRFHSVAFSQDGRMIVGGTQNGTIKVWRLT